MYQLPERLHSLPFLSCHPSFPSHSLFICQAQKNTLSFLLSYIKTLSDSLSPLHLCSCQCCYWALISLQSIASARRYPGKLFFCSAFGVGCGGWGWRGSKLKLTGLLMRQGEGLCSAPSPLCARPRTGNDIYTSPPPPVCQTSTCHSRGRSVFLCIYSTCVCRLN